MLGTNAASAGLSALPAPPTMQLCGFYRGIGERDDLVRAFIRECLRTADVCPSGPRTVGGKHAARPDRTAGDGTSRARSPLVSAQDICLGQHNFTVVDALARWQEWLAGSARPGWFTFASATGGFASAASSLVAAAEFGRMEAELRRTADHSPRTLCCAYDLDRCDGNLVVDIMKTQPRVLVGNTVVENIYHVAADPAMAARL